jgi:hypothetical protein
MQEIAMIIGFLFVFGFLNPSFASFEYFYVTNVLHITQMQYSMFNVIATLFVIFSSLLY